MDGTIVYHTLLHAVSSLNVFPQGHNIRGDTLMLTSSISLVIHFLPQLPVAVRCHSTQALDALLEAGTAKCTEVSAMRPWVMSRIESTKYKVQRQVYKKRDSRISL